MENLNPVVALNGLNNYMNVFYSEDLVDKNISSDLINKIPRDVAIKFQVIPIKLDSNGSLVFTTSSDQTLKNKRFFSKYLNGASYKLLPSKEDNVRRALVHYYSYEGEQTSDLFAGVRKDEDVSPLKLKIQTMIQEAAEMGASDIHILPFSGGVYIHFRIDGHMVNFSGKYLFPASEALNIVNIIKGLDTSNNADATKTNVPNRGSFKTRRGNVPIDVRLSTVPVGSESNFQKVNLRLLPQNKKTLDINGLGYDPQILNELKKCLLANAAGMFILSGPTGSGKTTSLYAQIYYVLKLFGEDLVSMTIENPIEIQEEKFMQVQVREAEQENLQLLPSDILKVGLRSDPDIFLYGEIRDKLDAKTAIEAATTGHRVFTTVHAANCVKTILRLLDLDVSKMSLLSEIRMIISQRLVRRLCPHCSRPHILTKEEKSVLSEKEIEVLSNSAIREKGTESDITGCKNPACHNGYVGRIAVAEAITFDNQLRDALFNQSSFEEVETLLRNRHFKSMWNKAFNMVRMGIFELQDVLYIIGKDT